MDIILKYFPDLSDKQIDQFGKLLDLYKDWNDKINVISRKDIDNLYTHHVLHSLTIAKFIQFKADTKIMDLGTGGGFPAIPLAIMFPEVQITAADGTLKKIKVVREIAEAINLDNVDAIQKRAEEDKGKYEFIVTRAVAKIAKLKEWTERILDYDDQRHSLPNGIIALKGGNLKEELKELSRKDYYELTPLTSLIPEHYFEEKYILYLQR